MMKLISDNTFDIYSDEKGTKDVYRCDVINPSLSQQQSLRGVFV